MDLTPYVDQLRRELAVAAEAGGDDSRRLAERLAVSLESAARLALLDALSAAAGEITRDLAPGSVDVRLRGRDPDFVVTPPPTSPSDVVDDVGVEPVAPAADAEEGATSRITLRLPEHLKSRVEEAAGRDGLSVNAWLVRSVAAALAPGSRGGQPERRRQQLGQRYTGWVR